ncbi:hypothetical protein [Ammoniphilus sp. 3BR4]|uniref:hypothetical protein n=1 Tax=Ammoniphilus sp. 3BR4 TaxID=3158265 RepID=UPI00346703CA
MKDFKEDIIQLYEEILSRRRHAFPPHFFVGDQGRRYASMITRYIIQEKLRWNRKSICLYLCRGVFETYRLAGMVKTYFEDSVFNVIDNAYPGEFQPWELVRARRHLFTGQNGRLMARRAVRWLIIEKLHYTTSDLRKVTTKAFERYHLDGVLDTVYEGSTWKAIQDAGLWAGQPWEIGQTPNGYWKGERGRTHALQAVKWLVEEKCKIPLHELPRHIRYDHFEKHGLPSMLKMVFKGSPFAAIDATYPGLFKPWQFGSVRNGFWNGSEGLKHAREALEWLIHDQLKLEEEEIPYVIGHKIFSQYGLGGMFSELFHHSTSKALDLLYPGRFTTQLLQQAKKLHK